MGDKETEAPQQDQDVTKVQTQDTPLATNQDNCSEDTNAAPENKECTSESPSEDTSILKSPKGDIPPEDRGDSQQEEPLIDVDKPDGASVTSNKESGDKSAVSTKETAKTTGQDDEGTLEALAAAEQNVSEKNVETIGPTAQVESTTSNSDASPRVKDVYKPDGASVTSDKESGDQSAVSTKETAKTTGQDDEGTLEALAAAEQNVSEKDVKTIGPTAQVESTTSNSDASPRVKDVDKPDGASVTSDKESGDQSAVSTKETAKTTGQDDEGTLEALAAAEQNVSEKDVKTIGPTAQVESTTSNSDASPRVKDVYKPDGASVTSDKESGDKSAVSTKETAKTTGQDDEGTLEALAAAEQNVSEKDVKTIGPTAQVESTTSNSDASPRVKDVYKPDGASVTSDKESGDKSAVSTEETAKTTGQDDEGTLEALAAAEQNVSEKDVKTIGPTAQVESTTSNSDASPRVKDVHKPDGASDPSDKESGDKPAVSTKETAKTTGQGENQEPAAPAAENDASKKDVKTVGPTPQGETTTPMSDVPSSVEDNRRTVWILIPVVLVAVVAVFVPVLLQQLDKDPPQKTDLRQIDIFHREMENLKVKFPSQREELWKRSRIHLRRHFLLSQPTEPVSIILTAGVRAESTLRCLAQSIASALSSALNVSALHLDGASKSSQDSDKVKSDIDSQLQKAFEGGKPIAVIHRFEELPPASTLIFYRYCDHENAAFKKTFLIFTVILGEEEEIQAKIPLSEVEEMVTDHLQKKFLSHGHPSAFDKMDIDKYGGLWSRISHLILPVATEKIIEKTQQC